LAPAGHREIDRGQIRGRALERGFAVCDGTLELVLEGVGSSPDGPSLLGIETREGLQDLSEATSLTAQELGLDLLEAAFVRVRDLFETLPQRF
jgi:hypothetical protein